MNSWLVLQQNENPAAPRWCNNVNKMSERVLVTTNCAQVLIITQSVHLIKTGVITDQVKTRYWWWNNDNNKLTLTGNCWEEKKKNLYCIIVSHILHIVKEWRRLQVRLWNESSHDQVTFTCRKLHPLHTGVYRCDSVFTILKPHPLPTGTVTCLRPHPSSSSPPVTWFLS